jgi:hypothetical protein
MSVSFDPNDDDYCSNTDAIELEALSGAYSGYSWTISSLGSYNYKVGPSLYQSACSYYQSLTYSSDTGDINYPPSNVATMYIYYDSDNGNVIKIGAFLADNAWEVISDMPRLATINDRAVECTTRTDGIESVWVATQNGTIQQWWTDTNINTTSTNQTNTWSPGPQLLLSATLMSANIIHNRPNLHRQHLREHVYPRPQHPDPYDRLLPSSQQLHNAAHVY